MKKFSAISLVFLLATTFFAFQVPSAYALDGTEMQITTDENAQFDPAIDGDYIVFTDNRAGNMDIYLHNLATGEEMPIAATEEDEFLNDVSGNYVVYTLVTFDDDDIYVTNIDTGDTRQITDPENTEFAMRRDPAVSGTYIVWQDDRTGSFDIYLYDLEADTETLLSTGEAGLPLGGDQIHPAIHENLVVWEDRRNLGNPDVYVYDISDPLATPILIPTDDGDVYLQGYPDVYGRYVVFDQAHQADLSNRDIILWDLDSNAIAWRTTNTGPQTRPRIDGTRVVWEDSRNGNLDIYAYDILTESVDVVVDDPATQFLCDISGNRIVWTDLRNASPELPGNYDIYMFEFAVVEVSPSYGVPGILATATGSGFPPLTAIDITFDGELVASVESDDDGDFTQHFAVPFRTPGIYTVTTSVSSPPPEVSASTTFEVLPLPIIHVSDTSLNFGNVELEQSPLMVTTITNLGNYPLFFSIIQTGSDDFDFTPVCDTVDVGDFVDVEVTYTPSDIGFDEATLTINSIDPNTPTVEVTLTGNGVEEVQPPDEMFQNLLDFYLTNLEDGDLWGLAPNARSQAGREGSIEHKIISAASDYRDGDIASACETLHSLLALIDGEPRPGDHIGGNSLVMEDFRQRVIAIMIEIGCTV